MRYALDILLAEKERHRNFADKLDEAIMIEKNHGTNDQKKIEMYTKFIEHHRKCAKECAEAAELIAKAMDEEVKKCTES